MNERASRARAKKLPSASKQPDNAKADRLQADDTPVAVSPKKRFGQQLPPAPVKHTQSWDKSDGYSIQGVDRAFKARLARLTLGMSPAGITSKYFEWFAHLLLSPGKQLDLIEKAQRKSSRFATYAANYARDSKVASLYRAPSPGPPVQSRILAILAAQLRLPGFSADAAVVSQRHH